MAVEGIIEKLLSRVIVSRCFKLFGWLKSVEKFYSSLSYYYWDGSLYGLCNVIPIDLIKLHRLL